MKDVAGYSRFGAQGGDWGQAVTIQLAAQFPESLAGIHFNGTTARPLPEANSRKKRRLGSVHRTPIGRPSSTTSASNPASRKPWPSLFRTVPWVPPRGSLRNSRSGAIRTQGSSALFTKDQLLTNVMFYLVTGTPGSAVWIYRGNADEPAAPRGRISVPTGFAAFPKEMPIFLPPRRFLERDFTSCITPACRREATSRVWSSLVCLWRPANILPRVRS